MMWAFRSYVIGGDTGSREGAWFLVLLWSAGFGFVLHSEAQGVEMRIAGDLLTITGPFVLAAWSAAQGLHKAIDAGVFSRKGPQGAGRVDNGGHAPNTGDMIG